MLSPYSMAGWLLVICQVSTLTTQTHNPYGPSISTTAACALQPQRLLSVTLHVYWFSSDCLPQLNHKLFENGIMFHSPLFTMNLAKRLTCSKPSKMFAEETNNTLFLFFRTLTIICRYIIKLFKSPIAPHQMYPPEKPRLFIPDSVHIVWPIVHTN